MRNRISIMLKREACLHRAQRFSAGGWKDRSSVALDRGHTTMKPPRKRLLSEVARKLRDSLRF